MMFSKSDVRLPACPPSAHQRELLLRLTLSSVFSDEEAEATARWLDGPKASEHVASMLIEKALARIRDRDNRKKASERRKEERRILTSV